MKVMQNRAGPTPDALGDVFWKAFTRLPAAGLLVEALQLKELDEGRELLCIDFDLQRIGAEQRPPHIDGLWSIWKR